MAQYDTIHYEALDTTYAYTIIPHTSPFPHRFDTHGKLGLERSKVMGIDLYCCHRMPFTYVNSHEAGLARSLMSSSQFSEISLGFVRSRIE